jgi:hypothetical protein
MLELNPSGFDILIALTSLMKIVWSFVWRKFSSVGREEWCNEMKNGQKLKLGDAHVTPRNIQEVQASKLGDPRHPLLHQQSIRSSFLTLYFYCFIYYMLFLEHLSFCFLFSFVLFAVLYSWIPAIFVLERTHSVLIGKNTLVFTLIVLRVFYFSSTAFSSCFSFLFCSELVCFLWRGMI